MGIANVTCALRPIVPMAPKFAAILGDPLAEVLVMAHRYTVLVLPEPLPVFLCSVSVALLIVALDNVPRRYDKAGNMTKKAISGMGGESVVLSMSYNKANKLTAMANGKDKITCSYDKNGSVVQKVLSS